MLLIGQFDSPFVRRVAVALRHHGLGFEHLPWSVWGDADKIAAHNPLRRVPVLVLDGGEALVDSAAILDAVDDLASDGRPLIARTGPERRRVLRICALATGLGDKAVSLLYERVLRGEAGLNPVWVRRCEAQIRETLDRLESERGAGEFWFGSFSHADIAVACALRFVREAHPALLEPGRPALSAHAERCEAMALFRSAVQALHVAV